MALASATKLAPYEIIAPLGTGGMGEVYRARDKHLGRSIAIKTLPAAFSADSDRLHRFGILLVGLLNIFTSFVLSFLLAVRARDIGEAKARGFLKEVGLKLVSHPVTFLLPGFE